MYKRILLVEDEESLQDIIKLNLELEGYEVSAVNNGKVALEEFASKRFDLVILDVMLPEVDGFTICQTIRLENTHVPILFLTAKSSAEDRVFGLKIGGDDYLTKPFNLDEFLLRVQSLLKRGVNTINRTVDSFKFGSCSIDFNSFTIKDLTGTEHQLSKREMKLLRLFVERRNEVLSRETILETVWGYDVFPSTRTIDNYILAFRKYFEKDPKDPNHFLSVRSVGYKFVA
ncbi:MAG: two-component system alkaline phosphatase synthesis response regulator PhoP [Bacteroidia bacterium]|jgi:two-component system alkaline phosphatase synthesis response regulator PhoP